MTKSNLLVIFSLLALSAVIGVIYLNFFIDFPMSSDAKVYDEAALNLLIGKGLISELKPEILIYPGYPVFLAAVYKVFGHNYDTVRFIQFFMVGSIAILIYFLGSHFKLKRTAALLAALVVLVWPYFIVQATLIYTEILFTFFLVSAIFFLLKFGENQSKNSTIFSGIFLALSALVRPEVLLLPFFIFFLFWLFFRIKPSKKQFLILLIFILLLLPWLVPSLFSQQDFSSQSSRSFLSSWYSAYPEFHDQFALVLFLKSQAKNFILFWNPGTAGLRAQALVEKFSWISNLFLVYKVFFFLILGSALLSWRFIKDKRVFLLWTPIFYLWLVHTFMYPSPRHTLPIIPLVVLLAFLYLQNIFNRIKSKGL